MKKLIIGITGGIGSGKSTVAQHYKDNGLAVLDVDQIAKQVMVKDDNVIGKIKQTFGKQSFIDQKLNTKYLADKVFGNSDNLNKLNRIVHPPTILQIKKQANLLLTKSDMVFVEAAILFEANWQSNFEFIILVTSDENIRIKRIVERNRFSEEKIKSIIKNQMNDKDKKGRADFTIENDGTIEELKTKSDFILSLIKSISTN
ncbi:MAG: dephospho-CoA kinase [Ignavibacteriae bacterium]|nr:dephospho-CoA kinase [Ignavibacteriota bacterium]